MRPAFLAMPAGAGPIAALVLASLLWGTADVAGKLALVAVPPATLAALRFGVALAIIWPLARWRGGPRAPMRITAPLGLLGVALTFLLQNLGLARTSATNASLLQGAVPVLTLLLAAAVLGERLGPRRIAAVAAVMAGVAAVTLSGDGGVRAPGLGDALVLASTGCFAAFIVLGRRAFPIYGTLPVLAGMAAWGTAALLPAAALELWLTRPAAIGPEQVALVLYLGAGCSALTYGLWGYALRYLEAGRAATFDALIPVVGLAAAVLVLREAPLAWHFVGGALVVAGIWLAVCEPRPAMAVAANHRTEPRFGWKMGFGVAALAIGLSVGVGWAGVGGFWNRGASVAAGVQRQGEGGDVALRLPQTARAPVHSGEPVPFAAAAPLPLQRYPGDGMGRVDHLAETARLERDERAFLMQMARATRPSIPRDGEPGVGSWKSEAVVSTALGG